MQLPSSTESEDDESPDIDDDVEEVAGTPIPGLPAGVDLNQIIGQAVSSFVASAMQDGIPGIASMLDWRKAKPPATPEPSALSARAPSTSSPIARLSTLRPDQQAKLLQINSQLTSEERELVRIVLGDLTPDAMQSWLAELDGLTVPDAVVRLRKLMTTPSSNNSDDKSKTEKPL